LAPIQRAQDPRKGKAMHFGDKEADEVFDEQWPVDQIEAVLQQIESSSSRGRTPRRTNRAK
jgi:hypothetical protein